MAFPFGAILSRIAGRAPARRSLEAATGSRRRWPDGQPSADAANYARAGAATVAARAQAFALNNPTGARITEGLVANLVGTGITPRPQHPGEAVRDRLSRAFLAWTDRADGEGRTDFYGLACALVRDMIVLGEGLAVFDMDADGAPMLRRLHPEQLARDVTKQLPAGGEVVAGVEFDTRGRVVGYFVRPSAPGEASLAGNPFVPRRIPASDVIHLFRPLVPGQVRGLSWFAPVLLTARELDRFLDAVLVRAKAAAMHAGFVTDPNGQAIYDGEQSGNTLDATLEPGAMIVLPPGKGIEFPDLPDQGDVSGLARDFVRMIAAGVGATYTQASGDYSQANYSSERAAQLEFRRFAEGVQHHTIVFQLCRPVWRRFVQWCALSGRIPAAAFQADRDAFLAVKWLPPAWPWVDPKSDAEAAVLAIDNNLRSRAEVVAGLGYDVEALDREIAADRARAERLGLAPAVAPEVRHLPVVEVRSRAADFRPTTIDDAARTVELVASRGSPVHREDFDGPFVEVLRIAPDAVDLSRLAGGMPLLDSHRQDGLDRVLGTVLSARIEGGELIALVQVSERHEGLWNDIKAGIVRSVSIGYGVQEYEDGVDRISGRRVRTIVKWSLMEISFVPVAADAGAHVRIHS